METITTHYFYDLSGRLAYCRNGRDEDYRYTYDQNNQVTKIENGNQFRKTETVYTYDKDGREKTAKTAAKTRQTAYDILGRVQSHSWTGTGGTIGQVDYIYDPGANGSQSNQLQKMTYGSDSISYMYFVKCFSQKSERNIPNFRNGIFPYISRKHFHMIMVQSVA